MTDKPKALQLAEVLDNTHHLVVPHTACAAAELRRLHVENETLRASLRRVIRTYMVSDYALDPNAELERLYQREIKR
jgi:hypothetical protein